MLLLVGIISLKHIHTGMHHALRPALSGNNQTHTYTLSLTK